jgi:chromosome segregation ATPase
VTDAFDLVEFEQVEAAPGTVLLRVAARPAEAVSEPPGPALLIERSDGRTHRQKALPSPPFEGGGDTARVAFGVPAALLGRGVHFSLELVDGTRVSLPAPQRRQATRAAERRPSAPSPDALARAEAERRAEARRLAVEELERRLAGEQERRREVEARLQGAAEKHRAELSAVRDELWSVQGELRESREEMRAARDERAAVEAALRQAGRHLESAQQQAEAATRLREEEVEQLQERLAEATTGRLTAEGAIAQHVAQIELLRHAVEELREQHEHVAQVALLNLTMEELHEQHQLTARQLAEAREDAERAEAAAMAGTDAVERLTTERDEAARELDELRDRHRATEQRLDAAQRDAASELGRVEELERELDRRQRETEELEAQIERLRSATDDRHQHAVEAATLATDLEAALQAARRQAQEESERAARLESELQRHQRELAGLAAGSEHSEVQVQELAAVVRAETERRERIAAELADARRQLAAARRPAPAAANRPARRPRLGFEAILGLILLIGGLVIAVLLLTGAIPG